MSYPLGGLPGAAPEPPGCSYACVLVRAGGAEVLAGLRAVRFTGWLAPPEATQPPPEARPPETGLAEAGLPAAGGWAVAAAATTGTVAAGRRDVVGVGSALARSLPAPVLAVRVVDERQLALVGWDRGAELGRYLSDPSYRADDDILPDPLGTDLARPLAEVCGRPGAAAELAAALADQLDPDSVNESERLARVLALLGLPPWLVAVDSLPRDIPTGPRAAQLTRLRAGSPGLRGRLVALAAPLTRRRPPPPVIADPPRGATPDPWFL